MNIENILLKNFGINKLTKISLRETVVNTYYNLPDHEKRRINREIAYDIIKSVEPHRLKSVGSFSSGFHQRAESRTERPAFGRTFIARLKSAVFWYGIKTGDSNKRARHIKKPESLLNTNVLAINHAGPLDITIEWKTEPDGTLKIKRCRIDSGGDQVNVSKVFSHFNEKIALVTLAGKKGGIITNIWKKYFLNSNIISKLVYDSQEDGQVEIYNMIDDNPLSGMHGWRQELSKKAVDNINNKAVKMLERMFKEKNDNIWMLISAGGPIRYNKDLAYYSSLVKQVKKKYQDTVKFLIDFKFMSGPEESLSVLDIPRDTPQDIIKPNLEEFVQILVSSGLAKTGELDYTAITEETVKKYAVELRIKYNLLGVLVSMDKSGLMLVLEDRIIKEKGINIKPVCHTAAGDSLKAGFIYALSKRRPFEEAVHTGNLFGTATIAMEGSQTVTPEKLAEIQALARAQNIAPEVEYLV